LDKSPPFVLVVIKGDGMYKVIYSPLDQFEIRNLFSIDTPLLGNLNLSITNIGLYMTIAVFSAFLISVLATNYSRLTPNK
jgi:F-type H+-transporting ATPase subunit a